MIYKIVVDKQPKENPSEEKRIYEIEIEELRMKGDVYDSLVITYEEDYIMRRLSLNEYMALNVLDTPIKEPLENINIELFEGDNYIYIIDVTGEKLYAEYLVENKFNQLYVTKSEMTTAINQSATAIELRVDGKITRVDGEIQEINAGLELKVDKDDNDQVVSMINASADEINLTSNRIAISSDNFTLSKEGNMTCRNANITGTISGSKMVGGSIELTSTTSYPQMIVSTHNYYNTNLMAGVLGLGLIVRKGNEWSNGEDVARITAINYNGEIVGAIELGESSGGGEAPTYITKYDVYSPDVSCFRLTQYSKEEMKKNFEKLSSEEALDIIKNTDIYKYNFKQENDNKKKHIGLIIGKNYKYSKEIISENRDGEEIGADTYSMISAAYKVIQMQQEKIEELEQRINKLEEGDN